MHVQNIRKPSQSFLRAESGLSTFPHFWSLLALEIAEKFYHRFLMAYSRGIPEYNIQFAFSGRKIF
jgi:hypothetical protein